MPSEVEKQGGLAVSAEEGGTAKALEYLAELAVAASRPEVFRVEGDPVATYVSQGEVLRRIPHQAPNLIVQTSSVRSFVRMLVGGDRLPQVGMGAMVMIHPNPGAILGVLNSGRLERIEGRLPLTPRLELLRALAAGQPVRIPASEVLRWLRMTLQLDLENEREAAIYQAFARLRFKQARTVEVQRTGAAASLGNAVEQAVEGSVDIPESFALDVYLLASERILPPGRVRVQCWVNHEAQLFEFWVERGELELVIREQLENLRGWIQAAFHELEPKLLQVEEASGEAPYEAATPDWLPAVFIASM